MKLYPAIITDVGLAEGIQQFIREVRQISPVQIRFMQSGNRMEEMADADKIAVFRIVQDYCSEVLRSTHANRVSISLHYTGPELILTFSTDDPVSSGNDSYIDFSGIQHRIRSYKGRMARHRDGRMESTEITLPLGVA